MVMVCPWAAVNSFASNGECGLKPVCRRPPGWRGSNSFASNGECGLKQRRDRLRPARHGNSFASNGECGLKQPSRGRGVRGFIIHSPAMANVD